MQGTIINVGAVLIGSVIGLIIHTKLPQKIITVIFQGMGLFTIVLGISMAVKTNNFLIMILSIVLGSIIGEFFDIGDAINKFSDKFKTKMKSEDDKFTEGFLTSSLLFCTGSMAILGAIEEGLGGEPTVLLAKSVLDGCASIVLAASFGVGVIFSAIPLLLYQGGLTMFASSLQYFFTDTIVTELTATGGVLLVGLGISILEIKELRIVNMLPSLVIVVILTWFSL